jgi:signal peptidase I
MISKIQDFLQKRRNVRKDARELIRYAHHARHMREDVISSSIIDDLQKAENALSEALKDKRNSNTRIEELAMDLKRAAARIMPRDKKSNTRENVEVIIIALAVALAFRTYFFQPFKIPTSSMQPTLNGIRFVDTDGPTIWDHYPQKLLKWIYTGDWYIEIKAPGDGIVRESRDPKSRLHKIIHVGDSAFRVNNNTQLIVPSGDFVEAGTRLVSGYRQEGDHLFVNKILWNFTKPKRGQVMVFKITELNIPGANNNDFYIKRMCGMPGDTMRIDPPYLVIDDQPYSGHPSIMRIQNMEPGYSGYQNPYPLSRFWPNGEIHLGNGEYIALGDNTLSSLDSRYWGPVPQDHLVGPAAFVYWPFNKHFGLVK